MKPKTLQEQVDNVIRECTLYAGKGVVYDPKLGALFSRFPKNVLSRDKVLWMPTDGKLSAEVVLNKVKECDMNKEQLIEFAKKHDACDSALEWLESCKDSVEIWGTINGEYAVWALKRGLNPPEDFDWSKLNGWGLSNVLRERPEFSVHCDWGKLVGWDWSWLLRLRPEFSVRCDWSKLVGWDWRYLLKERPEFSKFKPEGM